jgi:diaminopimelate epimerase
MKLHIYKYQGTGNDFILLDNREGAISLSDEQVAHLCDRKFGIGADGLMLLELTPGVDFRMVYYNADGSESTMCGNGGRCITAFARRLDMVDRKASFVAIDGPHEATVNEDETISLRMQDVAEINFYEDHSILNTGSPHYIHWVAEAAAVAVFDEGRRIRNLAPFSPKGINVNFVQRLADDQLYVRTYERGVEDETLSCGTGVTAAAIAAAGDATGTFKTGIRTPGGTLTVSFKKDTARSATDVILTGPAQFVFEATIEL